MSITLYGADYSVYVRIVRLALIEKGLGYDLVPVDIFAPDGIPAWYRTLHPFGRIPTLEHDGFRLFETAAITRYLDEAFPGPTLQPRTSAARATMNQVIGLLDAYAYRAMVWDIYVERIGNPRDGRPSNESRIAQALPVARTCVETLSRLMAQRPWLAGEQMTLADLHAAPTFAYFVQAPEGREMLEASPPMWSWWEAIAARPSLRATEPSS